MDTSIIARHLNIAQKTIIRVEEWANVIFVVAKKIGARFVSKKVVNKLPQRITLLSKQMNKLTLIELLKSDLNLYRNGEYALAVFIKKDEFSEYELQLKPKLTHEEILKDLKSREIKLEKNPNIFDHPGWTFIGSTSALNKAMQECKIEDIDREFEGFCFYMNW